MKKLLILPVIFFLLQTTAFANQVYSNNEKYGLKADDGSLLITAQYQKLIRLGDEGWIIQKKNKFGIMNSEGKILVKPKYRHVERVFGKFAKLGNEKDYGLYNEKGEIIIAPEFTSIEPLFGKMFLTCKKYKYGVVSDSGKTLLENEFDEIYMPKPSIMRIKYQGKWFELEKIKSVDIALPEGVKKYKVDDTEFTVTELITKTGVYSGYSVVTATDYLLKLFSSISPAYEDTIDELMFSKGAETVNIFIKLGWIPRFPFTYARKYYNNLIAPNNGPLAEVKDDLINQIK